jgi:CRP-like cAMP-binding protein
VSPQDKSPFDISQWLPSEVCDAFDRAARVRPYAPGETIYCQGDPGEHMFRLVSGAVRMSVMRADGRELLYALFEPGACFGVSSLIDGEPLPQGAEAAETSEIQVVSRAAFDQLRAEHRAFDDALLRLVTRHMRLLSVHFADAHLEDVTARVASRLAAACRSFGQSVDDGVALAVRVSQSDLASMVGGSRQTVNRVLQQFQREGLVSVRGGRLIVHDLDALAARAQRTG